MDAVACCPTATIHRSLAPRRNRSTGATYAPHNRYDGASRNSSRTNGASMRAALEVSTFLGRDRSVARAGAALCSIAAFTGKRSAELEGSHPPRGLARGFSWHLAWSHRFLPANRTYGVGGGCTCLSSMACANQSTRSASPRGDGQLRPRAGGERRDETATALPRVRPPMAHATRRGTCRIDDRPRPASRAPRVRNGSTCTHSLIALHTQRHCR